MKISDKPTEHIMIKAITNSTWDWCDFAIIHLTDEWKKEQKKRLDIINPYTNDYTLISMMYFEQSCTFYKDDDTICPDSSELLDEKVWAFVELNEETLGKLSVPENRIDYHRFHVFTSGYCYYQAVGKHTNEEFWTAKILLDELLK